MKQLRRTAASRRRGIRGGPLASKRAADARARALASILRKLRAAGFVSRHSLADELNRRKIPTVRGGRWQYTTVVRILTRLGLFIPGTGRTSNGETGARAADARAKALASTIRELQAKGLVSFNAIAHALNEREIPTALGGKWHPSSVSRLLARLRNLERTPRRR
jgi:recombinase